MNKTLVAVIAYTHPVTWACFRGRSDDLVSHEHADSRHTHRVGWTVACVPAVRPEPGHSGQGNDRPQRVYGHRPDDYQ